MKVPKPFKSIHLFCFVICVVSTTLWSLIAFAESVSVSGIIILTLLFLSPYCLLGLYRSLLNPPISISASITAAIITLAGNWLVITPEEARKGGLAAFVVFPMLFWAVGITIVLASLITQNFFRSETSIIRSVSIVLVLAVILNVTWFYSEYVTPGFGIVVLITFLIGALYLMYINANRKK